MEFTNFKDIFIHFNDYLKKRKEKENSSLQNLTAYSFVKRHKAKYKSRLKKE